VNTGNGGTEGRIAERLEGTIDGANPRGIRLAGEADWRNYSRWADKPASAPARGARVRLALDASGFVRSVQIVDQPPTAGAPAADRDRTISRLAVLKAAATFLGHLGQVRDEVRSDHVLVLAEKWYAWVQQDSCSPRMAGSDARTTEAAANPR
jgi:hypothetical protein